MKIKVVFILSILRLCGIISETEGFGIMPRKLKNPEMKSQWIALYQSGISTNEIAIRSGCHYKTVNNFLRENGIRIRSLSEQWELGRDKRIKQVSSQEIVHFYRRNLTFKQIAEKFRISNRRISQILKSEKVVLKVGFQGPHSENSRKKMGLKLSKHPHWKGGKSITGSGHILIKRPDHPFPDRQGYVLEHRLVMEKHLGRYLKRSEVVHHINDNPSDNRLSNLMLFPNNAAHSSFHRRQSPREKNSKGQFMKSA